jgi:hypothetical protein
MAKILSFFEGGTVSGSASNSGRDQKLKALQKDLEKTIRKRDDEEREALGLLKGAGLSAGNEDLTLPSTLLTRLVQLKLKSLLACNCT